MRIKFRVVRRAYGVACYRFVVQYKTWWFWHDLHNKVYLPYLLEKVRFSDYVFIDYSDAKVMCDNLAHAAMLDDMRKNHESKSDEVVYRASS